jgi:hypothetical protein
MMNHSQAVPVFAKPVLVDPAGIARGLERVRRAGLVDPVPNEWQIVLGVLRMWHRLVFRTGSVGTGGGAKVRSTWRARALRRRAVRVPFLLAERVIAPLDFSGLLSSRERIIRHLLGAHHDGDEFVYDFELLRLYPGALEELLVRAREVAETDTPRARWLKDLCVFDGYHGRLTEALEATLADVSAGPRPTDPDASFFGYLAWCAKQPATFEETLAHARAGRFHLDHGLLESSASHEC